MIAFGAFTGSPERFERYARSGIERVAGPDPTVIVRSGEPSIQTAYNAILDEAADFDELEGLVLLHEDSEIDDPRFVDVFRTRLADERVGVVGVLGARGVRGLAWWEGETFGGAGAPLLSADGRHRAQVTGGSHAVDAVDGFVMGLSPWAVRALRFDEAFGRDFHGYDIDYCFQARARGRLVVVEDAHVVHHAPNLFRDPAARDAWVRANLRFQRKWGGLDPRGERPSARGA